MHGSGWNSLPACSRHRRPHRRRGQAATGCLDESRRQGVDLPPGFELVGSTDSAPVAAIADDGRGFYGIQFHPEVTHTAQGKRILERFVHDICGCEEAWTPENIIRDSIDRVQEQVGADQVILGSPAEWIRVWWPPCCTGPSAIS